MKPSHKDNGRTPGQPGKNGRPKDKRDGFSEPHPKEDRRATVEPWKQKGLLPPLTAAEYEELRESIRQHGVGVPSIWDEAGNLIDGQNRERACAELRINCPREVREFSSEAEKLELAISLNIARRHLNRAQKRELIAAFLKAHPKVNDRHLGDIVKASKTTVAAERERLEATGQIDQLDKRIGRDGKWRPAKFRRIITNSPREHEKALEAIKNLPASCEGKILDATTATRRARKNVTKEAKDREIIIPSPEDDIRILHCRFQDLELPSSSVQLVATDIPYGRHFLPQIPDLAAFAGRVLVEEGYS